MIEQVVQVVQVVLNVAADLICVIPQLHLPLGQLDGLVDVELMLLYQLLLLLQDQLDVFVVLLAQLRNIPPLTLLSLPPLLPHVVVYDGVSCRRGLALLVGCLRVDRFDWDGLRLDGDGYITPISQCLAVLPLDNFRLVFILRHGGWLGLEIEAVPWKHQLLF